MVLGFGSLGRLGLGFERWLFVRQSPLALQGLCLDVQRRGDGNSPDVWCGGWCKSQNDVVVCRQHWSFAGCLRMLVARAVSTVWVGLDLGLLTAFLQSSPRPLSRMDALITSNPASTGS